MIQGIFLIGMSLMVLALPKFFIDVSYIQEQDSTKKAYEVISQIEEVKTYNDLYANKSGIKGTQNLLLNGIKPSELLVYDEEVSYNDGILLNKFDLAVNAYLTINPTDVDITCTKLANDTLKHFIKESDCIYITSKQLQLMEIDNNENVKFQLSEKQFNKINTIAKLNSNDYASEDNNTTNNGVTSTIRTYNLNKNTSELKTKNIIKKQDKIISNLNTKIDTLIESKKYLAALETLSKYSETNINDDLIKNLNKITPFYKSIINTANVNSVLNTTTGEVSTINDCEIIYSYNITNSTPLVQYRNKTLELMNSNGNEGSSTYLLNEYFYKLAYNQKKCDVIFYKHLFKFNVAKIVYTILYKNPTYFNNISTESKLLAAFTCFDNSITLSNNGLLKMQYSMIKYLIELFYPTATSEIKELEFNKLFQLLFGNTVNSFKSVGLFLPENIKNTEFALAYLIEKKEINLSTLFNGKEYGQGYCAINKDFESLEIWNGDSSNILKTKYNLQ